MSGATTRGPIASTVPLLTAVVAVSTALALVVPSGAAAQVPAGDADFRATAIGNAVHAEAIETPPLGDPTSTRVVDADVSFSSAVVDSAGLSQPRSSEFGALAQPVQEGRFSYARGYGLDLGLGGEGGAEGQIQLAGLAEAAAPPQTGPVIEEVALDQAGPLVYSSTLRGEAFANWGEPPCILGADLSRGVGYAEDLQLVDQAGDPETTGLDQPLIATDAADPRRSAVSSRSRIRLGPQVDASGARIGDAVGITSEVRQTIAPVTVNLGGQVEFTVEFLGEWVLRAHAGGIPGSAFVHYGPGEASPQTPVIRVIQDGEILGELDIQDLLGEEGLVIPGLPLVEVAVGEDPRAIGGDPDSQPAISPDGTSVAAAVDVARIRLLSEAGVGELAEIRVGHMEVTAQVPAGGLDCGLPIAKDVDRRLVQPGDAFTYTITVTNPYDCELRNVRTVDTITGDPGVTWSVTGTDPPADETSTGRVVWDDIGPIAPGASATVTIAVRVNADSRAGSFHDVAAATGECFTLPVAGEVVDEGQVGIPVGSEVRLDLPEVRVPVTTTTPTTAPTTVLPTTGAAGVMVVGGALLGAALTLRRRRW